MSARDALRDGDLDRALGILQNEVRASPDDPRHRIFLFQLLSVLGQWDRAMTQLGVIRDLDAGSMPMARTYQEVIRCEILRRGVFAGERSPMILGDPEPWMAQLVEALRVSNQGDAAASQKLRGQALEEAPTSGGKLAVAADPALSAGESEASFSWIADADTRLGPLLEVILNGKYYWVPFQRIARIDIDAPSDLCDIVWLPARFLWTNQGQAVGMIPTRYPGSEENDSGQIRLARLTEWRQSSEVVYEGIGQRILATDEGEYPILNVRRIEFAESSD
ncbi:MAG TPA: type VI secretion system accessory protein TagJ [Lacipirellulaceae bacterium]